jgi:hypothetical protein
MVVVPVATLLTKPLALMIATPGLDDFHSTNWVMSCVLLSLNVPVAVNCLVASMGMVELVGAIVSETRVAMVTVTEAVPLIVPEVAVTVAVPAATAVPMPVEFTVKTLGALDDHCADARICVLPSSNVPVAVNCCSVPFASEAVDGETVIEVRCAPTTVKSVESVRDPTLAVMVVVPALNIDANPVLLMVVTAAEDELQVTPLVRSAVVPSL